MSVQPRSVPASPPRKWWTQMRKPTRRRSDLVVEHLELLMEHRETKDSAAIRGFLGAWRKATANGNPLDLEIRTQRGKDSACVIFAYCPAAGPVHWLPVLMLPWTQHFDQIARECGDAEMFPDIPDRVFDAWEDRPVRRVVHPKIEIRLVRA